MSPELRAFLQSWIDWVDRGAPNGEPYFREYGLCDSAGCDLWRELELMFDNDGLDDDYPFGEEDFYRRHKNDTQHECPKRLAWVRNKLGGENAA